MSCTGELTGLIASVAALIAAYRDCSAIVQKLKARRAERREPAPPRILEESIDQAPEEIEAAKQRGVSRFGKVFEEGDHTVLIALQQITIQLQRTLLDRLRQEHVVETEGDWMSMVDAADTGRDRAVAALLEWKQRLLHSQQPSAEDSDNAPSHDQQIVSQPRSRESSQDATSGASGAEEVQQTGRRKRSSMLGFLNRHRRSSSGSRQKVRSEDGARRSSSTSPTAPCRDASETRERTPAFTGPVLEGSTRTWSARSSYECTERRDTLVNLPDSGYSSPRSNSANGCTIHSAHSPYAAAHVSSLSVPMPTPDNNYLGFCKCAWKLQNGDRKGALARTREYNDGCWQSHSHYLACCSSKCAFAGRLDLDTIWDRVSTVVPKGLKFRWPFLAKSHVPQHKVKDHQFAYQCIFCVSQGEKSPVFIGTDVYLDHVARAHRGDCLSEVILYKTQCIANRVADDSEDFDINLWPCSACDERYSDDMLDGPPRPANSSRDSAFSSEPWNEGLSDFHWGADPIHGEME